MGCLAGMCLVDLLDMQGGSKHAAELQMQPFLPKVKMFFSGQALSRGTCTSIPLTVSSMLQTDQRLTSHPPAVGQLGENKVFICR